MADLLWMPDTLRDAGLAVREIPGWQSRGHGAMGDILGVLLHHTAGPATGAYPSERIVVAGRPDLAGPLCNLGLDRNGCWIIVSNGQGWHAGTGGVSWCPRNFGNSHLIGVEAESVGSRNDWTPAQREAYPRGVAALLRRCHLGSYRAIGHKEWAPGRKIDPAFWDLNDFRAQVSRWMTTPHLEDDTVTPDDIHKIANAVLDAPVKRSGNVPNAGKDITLRTLIAWMDNLVLNGTWAGQPGAEVQTNVRQLAADLRTVVANTTRKDPS